MEGTVTSLADLYRAYIDCLNRQDWNELGQYVDDEVEHNGRPLRLSGALGSIAPNRTRQRKVAWTWPPGQPNRS